MFGLFAIDVYDICSEPDTIPLGNWAVTEPLTTPSVFNFAFTLLSV
jgi:hypothetical protein